MRRVNPLAYCLFAGLLLCSGTASGHNREVSYSFWTFSDNGARVRMRISQVTLSRAGLQPEDPAYLARAAHLLTNNLELEDEQGSCRTQSTLLPMLREGQLLHAWQVTCTGAPQKITSTLATALDNSHSHFISVNDGGTAPVNKVLTPQSSTWSRTPATAAPTAPETTTAFLRLGFAHILSGWDHLLFLLTLIALAGSLREVAWLATGFTLGHSLTLALAVLGLARPAPDLVEALIALSIIGLALENAWRLDARSRGLTMFTLPLLLLLGWLSGVIPLAVVLGLALFLAAYCGLLKTGVAGFRVRLALTAAFGLFHGFGFAGVLANMNMLPGKTIQALLGFNLGVELGQLLLLALAWPVLRWLTQWQWPAAAMATALAAGVGIWFYIMRIWG